MVITVADRADRHKTVRRDGRSPEFLIPATCHEFWNDDPGWWIDCRAGAPNRP